MPWAPKGGGVLLIPGDVCDSSFCSAAVQATVDAFGTIDILVNNAGYQHHQESIEDVTDEQLDRTFRTNIFGYFYMARAAVAQMTKGSSIINTGSITGLEGSPALLDYSSTKGAIHAFTKSLAQNLVDKGIRVNCVAPGSNLDAAERGRQAAEKGGETRPGDAHAAPRSARGSWRRATSSSPRMRIRATSPARS